METIGEVEEEGDTYRGLTIVPFCGTLLLYQVGTQN